MCQKEKKNNEERIHPEKRKRKKKERRNRERESSREIGDGWWKTEWKMPNSPQKDPKVAVCQDTSERRDSQQWF